MFVRKMLFAPLIILGVMSLPLAASATTITLQFTVDVGASSSPTFVSGQSYAGTFSWSDTSSVVTPGTTLVEYDASGTGAITLGGVASSLPITSLLVANDHNSGGVRDTFVLASADGSSSRIWLDDTTFSALSSVSVPSALNLSDWNFMRFDIAVPDGQVFGTLTSITVPEPGVVALLALLPFFARCASRNR